MRSVAYTDRARDQCGQISLYFFKIRRTELAEILVIRAICSFDILLGDEMARIITLRSVCIASIALLWRAFSAPICRRIRAISTGACFLVSLYCRLIKA
jgi:hypothetical protein